MDAMDSSSTDDSIVVQQRWQVTAKWIVTKTTFFRSKDFASQEEAVNALQSILAFCETLFMSDFITSSIIFSVGHSS